MRRFIFEPEHEQFRDSVRRFMQKGIAPHAARWREQGYVDRWAFTKAGEQLAEQELREFCKGKISHQKIPRYFQFVDAYPMTASGKVQKFVLREQAIQALGLQEIATIKRA